MNFLLTIIIYLIYSYDNYHIKPIMIFAPNYLTDIKKHALIQKITLSIIVEKTTIECIFIYL